MKPTTWKLAALATYWVADTAITVGHYVTHDVIAVAEQNVAVLLAARHITTPIAIELGMASAPLALVALKVAALLAVGALAPYAGQYAPRVEARHVWMMATVAGLFGAVGNAFTLLVA